jgi:hypothetical protein
MVSEWKGIAMIDISMDSGFVTPDIFLARGKQAKELITKGGLLEVLEKRPPGKGIAAIKKLDIEADGEKDYVTTIGVRAYHDNPDEDFWVAIVMSSNVKPETVDGIWKYVNTIGPQMYGANRLSDAATGEKVASLPEPGLKMISSDIARLTGDEAKNAVKKIGLENKRLNPGEWAVHKGDLRDKGELLFRFALTIHYQDCYENDEYFMAMFSPKVPDHIVMEFCEKSVAYIKEQDPELDIKIQRNGNNPSNN